MILKAHSNKIIVHVSARRLNKLPVRQRSCSNVDCVATASASVLANPEKLGLYLFPSLPSHFGHSCSDLTRQRLGSKAFDPLWPVTLSQTSVCFELALKNRPQLMCFNVKQHQMGGTCFAFDRVCLCGCVCVCVWTREAFTAPSIFIRCLLLPARLQRRLFPSSISQTLPHDQ